jgi:DNA primase catalytic subunit
MASTRAGVSRYYRQHFLRHLPALVHMATMNNTVLLCQREFGFTIILRDNDTMQEDETIVRNWVFHTVEDLANYISKHDVRAVHMGPVYPYNTMNNNGGKEARVVERFYAKEGIISLMGELMFDLDMNGNVYKRQGLCDCTQDDQVCDVCFEVYIRTAQYVMELIFFRVMKWTRYLMVFSGNRGLHFYVTDKRVITWTRDQRVRFTRWIIHMKNDMDSNVVNEIYCGYLKARFESFPALVERVRGIPKDSVEYKQAVVQAMWPVLDENVTTDAYHLHKVPMSLHPKSGNVSVIVPSALDTRFLLSRVLVHYRMIEEKRVPLDATALALAVMFK